MGKSVASGLVAVIRAGNHQATHIAEAGALGARLPWKCEVIEEMEWDTDIIKVLPGEVLGPAFVEAAKGPLPQAQLMPTGGVSLENVGAWINAGAVAVGLAGNLTTGAKTGDFSSITQIARQFVDKIRLARGQ